MQKGSIRVQTENIFPIIKKFLYSDHDIFIRELVSNAVDATQKLRTLSSLGEAKGELGDLAIEIQLDTEKKTITISDRGIGMTAEEVDKFINQVAFSGAEEFLNKYKGQNEANIIGHFGLGFYSSFMVSEKVEVITRSYKEDSQAVRWECDGSPEYSLEESDKATRGTDIVLHINEESKEFLDAGRIRGILQKFCRFLPVPIVFEGKTVNNTHPAWTKKPGDLTTQDYQDFYKELYPFSEAPLFWIHLNVDYPFNLTGILYFPKIKQSFEIQKDKIQLYSNQVFVTDEVKDIVPEFLMLLHGVIDSPDIPLNVSRSYLQGDPNVKKIGNHITKKVADKLEEIFEKERKEFEEKWESLGLFVKYGMMTDDKFLDRAAKFHIMEDTGGSKFYTLDEYRKETEAIQKNKDGKLVILYTSNPVQQDGYIRQALAKGYKVVKLETIVDAAFINQMEQKWTDVHFTRVDSEIADNLIDKAEGIDAVLSKEEENRLKELFDRQVADLHVTVEIKGLSPDAPPVLATRPEFMRRMKDMAAVSGPMGSFYANMPDEVTMTVNGNHPIYQTILKQEDKEKQEKLVHNLADLALLSQGLLKGGNLTSFIQRSVDLMSGETRSKIILEV
ncbi:MAG: molecular chaperone HtpG [Bacteroidota bacterium]|nr:molecular chaperone HtpG [Bacteroidota bacterium]MDP4218448.1 molecular chaperone HtpG [Bacteroidota bacterium]MDP4247277.1 molecular chaperone HtpG [Bacteroidota bacterium]MDP4256385.1 molecular chaperone HtpG [Bacteroidota bacterium]MDP4256802.1 molecular chaperone HtpG [Bacteroidota bacterium]